MAVQGEKVEHDAHQRLTITVNKVIVVGHDAGVFQNVRHAGQHSGMDSSGGGSGGGVYPESEP